MFSTAITSKKAVKITDLSEDLIITIFSKLPVKSIIRFKCVSKSWYKIIKSPVCIATHLNGPYYRSNTDDKHLVLLLFDASTRKTLMSPIPLNIFEFSSSLRAQLRHNQQFLHPTIVGSCNGLVCFLADKTCYVANPATRECKLIKESKLPSRLPCYGFGFDSKSEDYKLVRLTLQGRGIRHYKTEVSTLKNNSWRLIRSRVTRDIRVNECYRNKAVLANNALHWIGTKKWPQKGDLILAFDLAREAFREIAIPEDDHDHDGGGGGDDNVFYRCSVFRGCLSVAAICGTRHTDRVIKVWVMKEYGVAESWTVHCEVFMSKDVFTSISRNSMEILGFGNKGEPILLCGHTVIVFRSAPNPEKEDKYYSVDFNLKPLQYGGKNICIYRESLVLVN